MTSSRDYELVVIGGGPGGYTAAIRAVQKGAKTCLVEKDRLGGVCTNAGCIPTKVLVESARRLKHCRDNEEFGIEMDGCALNYGKVASRRGSVVSGLRKGIGGLLKADGVDLIRGTAGFDGPHTLHVDTDDGERSISADKVIVATGSAPAEVPVAEPDGDRILTSAHALELEELPESMIIVGGGYIGCEFACVLSAFGVEITVVEMLSRILPNMEEDCAAAVGKCLKRDGVTIHTETKLESCKVGDGGVTAVLDGSEDVRAEKMLVAVGREPRVPDLHPGAAGLETGEGGALAVNEHMQTAVDHIYAIGDVTGEHMLAHAASYEAKVAAEHATGTITATADHRVMPACAFTLPEIATVGLTEAEAKERAGDVKVRKFPLSALGKAHIEGATGGFVKMIAEADTHEVQGVHIVAPDASALIGEAALGMKLEVTADELAETIHPHPTMCESLHEAAEGVLGLPINWTG